MYDIDALYDFLAARDQHYKTFFALLEGLSPNPDEYLFSGTELIHILDHNSTGKAQAIPLLGDLRQS